MPDLTRFADVNDFRLAYQAEGAGVPIVLVHGAVTDRRFWRPQLAGLASRHRCIALDQRYFGESRGESSRPYSLVTHASDLSAFIDALGLGPVHIVATSYGAAVALASAVATPDRFASLFLNEPALSSLVTQPGEVAEVSAAQKELGVVAAALAAGDEKRAVELFCDWTAFPGAFASIPPELQPVFHDNAATVRRLFAAPPPTLVPDDLRALKMPVTLTTGQRTRRYFQLQVLAAREALPQSTLVVLPAAFHAPSFECAEAFNQAVLRHVAATVSRPLT